MMDIQSPMQYLHLKAYKQRKRFNRFLYSVLDNIYAQAVNIRDTVVVVGYARSGTTFLMEALALLLGARTSFEPLSDRVPLAKGFLHPHIFQQEYSHPKQMCFPYVRSNDTDEELYHYLKKALKGCLDDPRVWHKSRTPSNYWSRAVVAKLVWGNLLASWLTNSFGSNVIFLHRHPGGVVESILRQRWGWHFYDKSFLSLFLDQKQLVGDWLSPFLEDIDTLNEDPISRLTLGYAITHYVPFQQVESGEFTPLIVRYEDLIMKPIETFDQIGTYLGKTFEPQRIEYVLKQPSSSTQRSRKDLAPRQRCFGWQKELDRTTIQKIKSVVERFGLDQFGQLDHWTF